ncbi:E3 ubiquitin-protein ligase MIB2-like protein [Aphelenchoides avenae]|nr:E3 ubiquitin-protein ligase MIB2-like protein [Aphelenchus avenae]
MTNIAGIKIVLGQAFEKLKECQSKQLVRWEAEAKKHAQEVARLRAEAEATEKRLKQLTSDVNACVKRLCTLSTPSTKARKEQPLNETEALIAAASNAERTIKAERERTKHLEKEIANAVGQLQAMRAAYDDASYKALNLEAQLKAALEKGNELDEKLRCSICMDRQKNVAFACGHAYCKQCASEWNTCSFSCKRPNSDKPVKFRYPLFL